MTPTLSQRWHKLALRIDAMAPRERLLCFAAVVLVLVMGVQSLVLGPVARKQEALRTELIQQSRTESGIADEITARVAQAGKDPNQLLRDKLSAVRNDTAHLGEALRNMQKGMVPPERMAPLLEAIVRANGRLQLVSLRTLPVDTVDGAGDAGRHGSPNTGAGLPNGGAGIATAAAVKAASGNDVTGKPLFDTGAPPPAAALSAAASSLAASAAPAAAGTVLYRHGVELTVRGGYLDMVDYMAALEALPTSVFWGRARLTVDEYPQARLTLTLYTLSLDPKWMKL